MTRWLRRARDRAAAALGEQRRRASRADALPQLAVLGLACGLVAALLMIAFRTAIDLGQAALLPAGPRKAASWMPMLVIGTVCGGLLALDTWLGLDRTSFLYPVWQAAVGVRLAMALRH